LERENVRSRANDPKSRDSAILLTAIRLDCQRPSFEAELLQTRRKFGSEIQQQVVGRHLAHLLEIVEEASRRDVV
jgi:hypothetical protein